MVKIFSTVFYSLLYSEKKLLNRIESETWLKSLQRTKVLFFNNTIIIFIADI